MKILVTSGTDNEHSLGNIYAAAFKKLEHDVQIFYDLDEMEKESPLFKWPIFRKINWWRLQKENYWGIWQKIIVKLFEWQMDHYESLSNKKFLALCTEYKPDVLFVVVGRTLRKDTLLKIKKSVNCFCITYNGDSYDNLHSTSSHMLDSLPFYDLVLTWSNISFDALYKLGSQRVEYLPFAFDESVHKPAIVSQDDFRTYGHEIVFIGTWDKEREKWLESLADYDLGIWGPGWNKVNSKSFLGKRIVKSEGVNANEMSKIYQTSKICLNLMRSQNDEAHNMKSFEIPALGGFMLANRSQDHLNFFKEGEEAAFFEDMDELRSQIMKYISDDKYRNCMSERAQKIVRENHSYLNRAKEVLNYIGAVS
jgi:spore maturation protein CgeB